MARFSLEDEEEEMGDGRRKKRSGGAEEIDRRSPKKGKKSKTKGKREMGNEVEGEEEAEVAAGEEEGGEGGEVEEEEKKEAEQGDGGISSGKENGDGISVRIDPDVLDCCICYEPLRPPLLQCSNGHVACCSCWSKLDHKCYLCSCEISFSRNLALEKIIESIKISCRHAKYGCRRTINYTQRDHHEETCIYAPCYCPVSDCTFSGSTVMLSAHFSSKHSKSSKRFCYGQPFKVNLKPMEPFFVLQGDDGHLFLLLNNRDVAMGYALSIACIRPDTPEGNFSYELTATGEESSVLLKACTTNIKEWKGVHPTKAFLLVPHDFFYSSGIMLLDVCIQKSNLVL
ncbi:putative E3 ubiquitin-protein ligase SINA-like 9 isoform X1 [Phoenix dactylifera]|uniref:RING-type E3 ubiquitin transferase n=1 Tax=Phoenix dactylifera TaxID=42345 RepID=A0A8B7D2Q0_PHODC|nr:putative E3 ubiquitin-protein ligase SINA-like 9 isoform X1 [Phoenix dactylifera]